MRLFTCQELQLVQQASQQAAHLVSRFYCFAPREWTMLRYEVKTQEELTANERLDTVLAQVLCYQYARQINQKVEYKDLYCICLQDTKILNTFNNIKGDLFNLLLYVLTHELVHVVRFGQQLQRIDLAIEERNKEEEKVEIITEKILSKQINYLAQIPLTKIKSTCSL